MTFFFLSGVSCVKCDFVGPFLHVRESIISCQCVFKWHILDCNLQGFAELLGECNPTVI